VGELDVEGGDFERVRLATRHPDRKALAGVGYVFPQWTHTTMTLPTPVL